MAVKKLIGLIMFLATISDFLLIIRVSKLSNEQGLPNPCSQSPLSSIIALMFLTIAFFFGISLLLEKFNGNKN
ncbi:hypothetical protein [Spongiivirga citrea]|uniref:Uncharacterized protein n=1 Tax=Spongiivirga citrea TaxID=1481457 RepID=A0A6M0CIM1_9FLAO|nr:hypothetical protein [Spongiivirga citrea]NER16793.1 hypothetical protein [Spongiivirga citrea]